MRNKVTFGGIIFWLLLAATAPCFGQPLVIAGTGDSQEVLRKLAALYQQQHPDRQVEVPDSVGSGGGVKAVQQSMAGLARTARPLKENERPGLNELMFGHSPIVFVTHPTVAAVSSVTGEQILQIYGGTITNWKDLGGPDHKIYPVDREPGDSSRKVLKKKLAGFEELQSVGKVFYSTGQTASALAENAYTIGFLPLSVARDHGLHILKFNDQLPDQKSIEHGQYPLLTPFFLVFPVNPGPAAVQFLEFIDTPAAKALMLEQGVVPAR